MIKDLSSNRCVIPDCNFRCTPEGLCCSYHWSWVPGAIKSQYQSARIMAIKAVRAKEIIPPLEDV